MKDEDGKPVIENESYKVKDLTIFTKELDKIKAEFKEVLDKRDEIIKKNNELLDEEVDLDFYKVKSDNLPEELSLADLEALDVFISE